MARRARMRPTTPLSQVLPPDELSGRARRHLFVRGALGRAARAQKSAQQAIGRLSPLSSLPAPCLIEARYMLRVGPSVCEARGTCYAGHPFGAAADAKVFKAIIHTVQLIFTACVLEHMYECAA